MYEFKLPDLGEGIHEGEILNWHVAVGDTIAEDDPLVEIETDKAAVTIPSPRAGKIVALTGGVGDIVNVGQVITVIDDGTTDAAIEEQAEPATVEVEAASVATAVQPAARAASAGAATGRRVPAAPATRRLARELGVDINIAMGSGPAGRVLDEDVRTLAAQGGAPAAAGPQPVATPTPQTAVSVVPPQGATDLVSPASSAIPFLDIEPLPDFEQWGPVEREPLRSIRRKIARKMVTSMVLIPHVGHTDEADITMLEQFRKRENELRRSSPSSHLTILPFVIKAVTAGLRQSSSFNSSLDPFGEEIIHKKYYNIGIAVDSGHGLVVPVIKDTESKSVMQLATEIEDLATRAREGKLELSEMRGGTFTITNVGPIGGNGLVPTINYPEVAILGMGRAKEKPVVVDGQIVIRKILPLTLGFDHRVADGADAARFVRELVRQLSDPNLLLLET